MDLNPVKYRRSYIDEIIFFEIFIYLTLHPNSNPYKNYI